LKLRIPIPHESPCRATRSAGPDGWRPPLDLELGAGGEEKALPGDRETLPQSELSRRLPALKRQPGTAWLEAVDSQALQQAFADLERAFVNCS
jgi:hypothetical protein